MKKGLLIICLFLPLLHFSQHYNSAIGIKTGYPGIIGVNFKKYLNSQHFALDNMAGANFDRDNRYVSLQTLLEYNKQFGRDMSLGYNWYAGLGPEVQYYVNGGYLYDDGSMEGKHLFARVNGVLGVEYTAVMKQIPFNAALEVQPCFNITPVTRFYVFFDVAIRYTFKKIKTK